MAGVQGECVTARVAQITRDTGPSGALSGMAASVRIAATPTPSGQAGLTRSCAFPRSVPRLPHRADARWFATISAQCFGAARFAGSETHAAGATMAGATGL